jgi:FixJ family two-component response regulator
MNTKPGNPVRNAHRKYTILIVDDDVLFRRSQQRLLSVLRVAGTQTSFEVLEADNGATAMKTMAHRKVDCVLLDQAMPGGDGTLWIRKMLAAHPDLAVIMVTGAGNEQVAVQAMQEGAMDYLVKGAIDLVGLELAILNSLTKVEMRLTIEKQQQELVEAEKQRVMIASLGAARHHIGQPISVITVYLELMKRKETDPELREMIHQCELSAASVADILRRLGEVSRFRTEPYLPGAAYRPRRSDEEILAI